MRFITPLLHYSVTPTAVRPPKRTRSTLLLNLAIASISSALAQTAPPSKAAAVPARFKQYDKNGDGKVTAGELPDRQVFDRFDANKDGSITPEEYTQVVRSLTPKPAAPPAAPGEPTKPGESPMPPATPASPQPTPTLEMELHKDIRYRDLPDVDAQFHSLDVYVPSGVKKAPVMFFIHGGGLTGGSKDPGKRFPSYCARMGMVLVTINYRLSPAVKHPAHIQDCAAAFQWTCDNIPKFGGDPTRIFVAGHSSGAQLANLLCTDGKRLAGEGLSLAHIKGAIIFDSAAYDMTTGRVTAGSIYEKAFGTDTEILKDGSPVWHIAPGRNIPPHLLLGAKPPQMPMETKVKNLDAVAVKYRAAGVRCEVACAPFRQHNTLITEFGPAEEPVTVEVTKFIQSILNAEPVNPPLGGPAKVLHLPGKSEEDVQRENDIQSAKTLLKMLDTNGDRKVSRAEAEARGGGHGLRWFPLLDKDKDGFVTVEEQTGTPSPDEKMPSFNEPTKALP